MRLIDTHCHLYNSEAFPDPAEVVARAVDAGVDRMIVIGIDSETSLLALELAERFEGVYATVGWHPTNAARWNISEHSRIADLAQHDKVVAVGEIGLDFYWDYATHEQQFTALVPQIELAHEVQLPIVWHCREAYPVLLDYLEANKPGPNLFHCFAGTADEAQRAVALGSWFGVDGPLTYPKAQATREIFATLPRNRVVIETDAPYLTPVPYRGKLNEPAYVKFINAKLAEVWGITEEECATQTTQNAEQFFHL